MAEYLTRDSCRVCARRLASVLDLGPIIPSTYLKPDAPDPSAIPLDLCICTGCGLVQLAHTTDPEALYRQYWYRSGVNPVMEAELLDVVATVLAVRGGTFSPTDLVVDVGANDGTLLAQYARFPGSRPARVAYEPAANLIPALGRIADVTFHDYFPPQIARHALPTRGVSALTSIAMFYDLEDPRSFVREVDRILTDAGVWIVQFQDLANMVQATGYDNICHEHLCYYSLQTFRHLLEGTDLAVIATEQRAINGGSLRIIVRRAHYAQDAAVQRRVADALEAEAPWISWRALEQFAARVEDRRQQLIATVQSARAAGRAVDLYAASTKSATLLQYCGLNASHIRYAVERSPEKWGLVTAGTRIPIVSEDQWRQDPADVAVIGAWQFAESFIAREAGYLDRGGRFVVPLPDLRIVKR